MSSDVFEEFVCHYCQKTVSKGQQVDLWDGNTYCEDCVESASPGLSEYARNHPSLEEVMPTQRSTLFLRLLVVLILEFMVCMMPHKETLETLGWGGQVMGAAIVAGLFYGAAILGALTVHHLPCSLKEGRVLFRFNRACREDDVIDEGLIRRNAYSWEWSRLISWRESSAIGAWHGQWFAALIALPNVRRPVIVLEFPPKEWFGLHLPVRCLACGWTPEMREYWKAMLVLGRVPQQNDVQRKPQRTSRMAIASLILSCVGVLFFPLLIPGIICGHVARRKCRKETNLLGDLYALVGIMIGYIFVAIYLLALVASFLIQRA